MSDMGKKAFARSVAACKGRGDMLICSHNEATLLRAGAISHHVVKFTVICHHFLRSLFCTDQISELGIAWEFLAYLPELCEITPGWVQRGTAPTVRCT